MSNLIPGNQKHLRLNDRLTLQADFAMIHGQQPENHFHRRRFAGTVLPNKAIDAIGRYAQT